MRLAVVQLDAGDGGTPAGRAAARHAATTAIVAAAGDGADVVVLPEYASGWCAPLAAGLVEAEDGPFLTAVRAAALAAGVSVVAWTVLPGARADRGRNTAVVIDPSGEIAGRYVKTHLYDAYGARESDLLDAGDPRTDGAPLVVEIPSASGVIRLGVATCYDLRFPEPFRALVDSADGPVDVIAVGAAWAAGPGKAAQLRTLVAARAIENTAYVALASQAGRGRVGGSVVVDPRGVVVAEVDAGADDGAARLGAALALVDPDVVAQVRAASPVLAHRRYRVVPAVDSRP